MCAMAAPARRNGKGVSMKRALVGVSAAAVALVSFWLYQPSDEPSDKLPLNKPSFNKPLYRVDASFSTPQRNDVEEDSDYSAAMIAVAGAALVLVLLVWRRAAHSHGSASSSKHQKTLAGDLGALLRSAHSADVTFTVGDRQLKAHRAVLVARSPVFAAMFAHDCLEASSGEIAISDTELDVLSQLLAFMYTDEAQLNPVIAPKLLVAADKYHVHALKEECEHVISRNLCVENAAECAVLAVQHSCSHLLEPAARFIAAHFRQVMATKGWAQAICNNPSDVVEVSRVVAALSPGTR